MKNLENIFVAEFRQSVKEVGYKDIYSIPLPPESKDWYISGTELYVVKDVEDKYYSQLNKSVVRKIPKNFVVKRRVINKVTRSFKKYEQGNFIYEDYKIKTGHIAVISKRKLGLPYKYIGSNGEDYVDFVETNNGLEYIYILSKTNLYKVNQTALVLSVKNMKNFQGMGYKTWEHGTIFLHIIPYNPNAQYVGSKILKTGYTLDYSQEIKSILDYWQQINLIPNISLCSLQDLSICENIALKQTTVGYPEYFPVESLSLGDKEIYGNGGLNETTNEEG